MRIVLISGEQYPFFIETANALHKKGYKLHVFCFRDLRYSNYFIKLNSGITFHRDLVSEKDIDNNNLFKLKIFSYAIKLTKRLTEIKPDILHAFNLKWSGWISAMSGFRPFILSGLGSDILIEQGAASNIILKYLREYTIKRANFISVVSEQMKQQVLAVDKNKDTLFFPSSVDPNEFIPKLPPKDFINKFKENNQIVIFSPRALKPLYQIKEIIFAFNDLIKNGYNIFLIIGGKDDNDYSAELKKIVTKNEINNKVFFTGRVPQEEWLNYYRTADIIVSYPYNDGMPSSIFEAMAMKKVIVLSDVQSIRQIFRDGEDSLFVDRNNYKDLSKKIKYLIKNSEKRKIIIENAYNTFQKYGNRNNNIEKLERVYRSL